MNHWNPIKTRHITLLFLKKWRCNNLHPKPLYHMHPYETYVYVVAVVDLDRTFVKWCFSSINYEEKRWNNIMRHHKRCTFVITKIWRGFVHDENHRPTTRGYYIRLSEFWLLVFIIIFKQFSMSCPLIIHFILPLF